MAKINKNELTQEQIEKALQCETADELLKLAEAEGYEMTKDEAEAYIEELANLDLDEETLRQVAGGNNCTFCPCQNDYEGRINSKCNTWGK